jgi:26S proteasome regulatory subunit N2
MHLTRSLLLCLTTCPQVLRLLIRLYEECEQPDYVVICQCLMFLDDAPEVAKILNKLLNSGNEVRCLVPAGQGEAGLVGA